jgi:hypothetical protein
MNNSERREGVRSLWLQRSDVTRTGIDVLVFYFWLKEHCPNLLLVPPPRSNADPASYLKSDLSGLWKDED